MIPGMVKEIGGGGLVNDESNTQRKGGRKGGRVRDQQIQHS
jgi:hypothetical protein